jgi:leucyl-tRNA synthetase
MDTFVDSSWYFFRYCSPGDVTAPFDPDDVRRWMPVAQYVGGVEHAILHLLYMRFFTKVLFDMGLVDFEEPFTRLLNQGVVINQGKKMSKSLGNGVSLGDQLADFGVDAVRLTLVFAGPPEDNIDWADLSPAGSLRFLQRAWRLSGDVTSEPGTPAEEGYVALRKATHQGATLGNENAHLKSELASSQKQTSDLQAELARLRTDLSASRDELHAGKQLHAVFSSAENGSSKSIMPMSNRALVKNRLYNRCSTACSTPPTYWSAGIHSRTSRGSKAWVSSFGEQ